MLQPLTLSFPIFPFFASPFSSFLIKWPYHLKANNTHTSLCIIVHLCTIATATMHICTATVACAFYILIVFYSLLFFSFFFIHKTNSPSHVLFSSDTTHSHRHKIKNQLQKSKINHKINKKNQPLEQNRWIGGVDGNR